MSVSTLFIPWECKHYCGKAVLIRNFAKDIGEAYMADVGIKMALGYNPRSTTEWQAIDTNGSNRDAPRKFVKSKKNAAPAADKKKVTNEVEPLTEVFMDILSNKYKMMIHLHKEDDVMILIQLVNEFGIKAVANHCADVH